MCVYVCVHVYVCIFICVHVFYVFMCACMCAYVHVCICMHVCVYVYVCACVFVPVNVRACICMHVCICACMYMCVYVYVCLYVCMCLNVYVCMCMCACVHVYVHVCICVQLLSLLFLFFFSSLLLQEALVGFNLFKEPFKEVVPFFDSCVVYDYGDSTTSRCACIFSAHLLVFAFLIYLLVVLMQVHDFFVIFFTTLIYIL